MKYPKSLLVCACLFTVTGLKAQEFSKDLTVSLFTGVINYQGDLNPNSFTFKNSNFSAGITVRKPISRWFALRAGVNMGTIEAADRNNRDYLKPRNLSFKTSIKEAYAGLELTLLNSSTSRITPYIYGGIAVFHFNPWTYDNNGEKTFLKPLGTEGQGLPQYPSQKPYNLTQLSLPFGGGIRYALNDGIAIGIEFSQRKSFTDYIDDVSTNFVDYNTLLQARGPKAVELAYRGDEIPGGAANYPVHGEQRGTPSEMDWYYFLGTTLEIKLSALGNLFKRQNDVHGSYNLRCPRNVNY
ncbi:MAG TPA: DUF6089 family protein [Chitinophagaceae bacterium]|jgi:opacity protein-like surface antigen|nr:DUF6089 family protein [Chitinophagaceae bacterium]